MPLFKRLTGQVEFPRSYCDAQCRKCSTGRCTRNVGHTGSSGHQSNGKQENGKQGCGHAWGGL